MAKLQENQETITDKLDDQEAAMTQALLTQQQQRLPLLQQAPQQPALAVAQRVLQVPLHPTYQ